jgi:phosphatidylinositol alpha-1,6-mannosyltransferase
MRMLLVTNDYPPKPGGIQQYLGNFVAAYPDPVRVLAPADEGAEPDPGVVRGHRRFMWPTRRVRRWVEGQIADFRPDIVLFGAPHPLSFLGPRLRRSTGVPYAVLCHGAEVTIPAAFPISRQLLRWPLRRADACFAVSRFTAGRVERLTGRPTGYVGAGVDVDAFTPAREASQRQVVGCVSRFVPRKGQGRLLEAIGRLRDGGADVEVLMVGSGRRERHLRRLAAKLDLRVRFEVAVPWADLPGLYREMTIFAMPCRSRWFGLEVEGLGLVFLEASAAGLPVLAGDSGGSPETVVPGVTGFVVSRSGHISEGIRFLLADARRAASMGAAGRRRVVEEFTWEAVAGRFMEGLREVVVGEGREDKP